MTEERNALAEVFAACWKDDDLKARFIADPKAVLSEFGMTVPDGLDLKVVENTDDCVHITLPVSASEDHDVADSDLTAAAGGHTWPPNQCSYVTCKPPKGGC